MGETPKTHKGFGSSSLGKPPPRPTRGSAVPLWGNHQDDPQGVRQFLFGETTKTGLPTLLLPRGDASRTSLCRRSFSQGETLRERRYADAPSPKGRRFANVANASLTPRWLTVSFLPFSLHLGETLI